MPIPRIVSIIGIILCIYALFSGIELHYSSEASNSWQGGYEFKIGLFLIGICLWILGKRLSN